MSHVHIFCVDGESLLRARFALVYHRTLNIYKGNDYATLFFAKPCTSYYRVIRDGEN